LFYNRRTGGKDWTSGVKEKSGQFRAVVQGDGNVVNYNGNSRHWSTDTHGFKNIVHVAFGVQGDGNLVVYLSHRRAGSTPVCISLNIERRTN
jgi:hypothetical protein